ncbi:hypothetical protein [Synechococcus sp. CC9605]|nr:hypothetical protein [Synechococcus sp. CC9605]
MVDSKISTAPEGLHGILTDGDLRHALRMMGLRHGRGSPQQIS